MKHVERRVWVTDDFGSAGDAETVRFSLEGRDFEIDLNKRNRETFLRRFKPYTDSARDVTDDNERTIANRRTPEELAAIRAWAQSNGVPVALRGRIPADVLRAYEDAA